MPSNHKTQSTILTNIELSSCDAIKITYLIYDCTERTSELAIRVVSDHHKRTIYRCVYGFFRFRSKYSNRHLRLKNGLSQTIREVNDIL